MPSSKFPRPLPDPKPLGRLDTDPSTPPLDGGQWYVAPDVEDALQYDLTPGDLAGAEYLTFDLLVDGDLLVIFELRLREAGTGRTFLLIFTALNQCQARVRFPLSATGQKAWKLPREAAWLKPLCMGDPVDPAKVDRVTLAVLRKAERPARWCQTPLTLTAEAPGPLTDPILPAGPLMDEFGQYTLRDWPGRTHEAEEISSRVAAQLERADTQHWPESYTTWGGWTGRSFEATGWFRTQHDGRRWWLVDPDGGAFWSAGMDCVRPGVVSRIDGLEPALTWVPEPDGEYADARRTARDGEDVCYLTANLIRALGAENYVDAWSRIALGMLRDWGFNTVANWSDWRIARKAGFPYVRPLSPRFERTPRVFRQFPDVFADSYAADAADFAEQLRETLGDPAMIGYFLMNEPNWGFATETPAEGMLRTTERCATREALAEFLRDRYDGDAGKLAGAWGEGAAFDAVAAGPWTRELTAAARADLAAFSSVMVERFFTPLCEACRKVDPDHLNLGARYYTVPPDWACEGMKGFDVFSVNCYKESPPADDFRAISHALGVPVMIGEWHFGALDVGLPGSGIGRVRNQAERGRAFRVYQERAAALECCVGAHHFTLYDESALGRGDGENWNIGFVDVCHRVYEPLADAARETHRRLYEVADGRLDPFEDEPDYPPKLFC